MIVDESLTNWSQLTELIDNYRRRIEDTSLCEGAYATVPDRDEELGKFIGCLQYIYHQHQIKAAKRP